jgi:hypothetical protein
VGLYVDLAGLDDRLDEGFAAAVFSSEERRDVRSSLWRDLLRLRPHRLKVLHRDRPAPARASQRRHENVLGSRAP